MDLNRLPLKISAKSYRYQPKYDKKIIKDQKLYSDDKVDDRLKAPRINYFSEVERAL